jgi:LysR family hydrogen peroxide-inducible transcriptional activator
MQMHQIRYFLALCDERSFTRAARRIGVSQPSLTSAIAALEYELGGALFQRRPLVTLTALGHAVYPYFERIAENSDRAGEVARALTHASVSPPNAAISHQSAEAG